MKRLNSKSMIEERERERERIENLKFKTCTHKVTENETI
jgi:hypothetical protein